ncbi:hypothetical protein Dsin_028827 [Dipteronia sinensis]|uniref:Uncharacterized protein n=1 Tax=Dipteronia sinensis TaxID=43782 RepID=A0AAE0DUX6_9ROSI|nr:hypothetical protein Dsin_028827 [Dipteronia sinensis]
MNSSNNPRGNFNKQANAYQPKVRLLGEELRDFIKATDEASIAIRNSQSTNEQMLRNYIQSNDQRANSMGASIRRLETQVTQIAEALHKQDKWKSQSNNEHIKLIEVLLEKSTKLALGEETQDTKIVVEDFVIEKTYELEETSLVKPEDLGDFIIPVTIGESEKMGAVLDMGASVNMMPLKVYMQLNLRSIKATPIELKMADNSPKGPCGVVEDVQLDIHGLKVPVDFIVLEVKEDESDEREWKLLLGRSFMATTGMEVNVVSRHLSFSCGGSKVKFYVDRPDERHFEGFFVLEVPKGRKKKSRVGDIVKAFELATNMEKGHQDGFEEKEAVKMEEAFFDEKILEEISRNFEQEREKELEDKNKELHQN